MQVVDPVSGERTFLIIESHEDDIEGIDQIDSEDGRDRGDLPSGDYGECRDHESDEHRPGLPEEHMRFYIIEPADEDRWEEYCKTEQHEYRVGLGKDRRIDQIEFDREHCHHQKRNEGESGSESWDPVRPVHGIEYDDVPDDSEEERDEVDLEGSENDIVLIEIENSPKYIGNVPDLDTCNPDDRSHTDLHHESDFRGHEKRRIPAHLPEFLGGFFYVAFALPVEFMDRIEIVYETYECHDRTKHEDNRKPVLIDIAQKRMEEEGEEEEIEIENTSNTERYRFSLVSVGRRIIEEPEAGEEVFPDMEYDERGDERYSEKETELYKEGE